jgi:myo-inositol 2-dehydrogenase/D-chiro-inositol 1-dehydrogenase
VRPHRPHARPQRRAHPRAELVAVYDVAPAPPQEVGAALGDRVAGSVDEVLADRDVEAVFIASSTDTHVDLLTRAAKAGKAVLCEKPIDLDIGPRRGCWREIGRLDPLVMVGLQPPLRPLVQGAVRPGPGRGEVGSWSRSSSPAATRARRPPPTSRFRAGSSAT